MLTSLGPYWTSSLTFDISDCTILIIAVNFWQSVWYTVALFFVKTQRKPSRVDAFFSSYQLATVTYNGSPSNLSAVIAASSNCFIFLQFFFSAHTYLINYENPKIVCVGKFWYLIFSAYTRQHPINFWRINLLNTPLGSGWADPRAPGRGGTQAKAKIFLKLYSILLIHIITLYLGAPPILLNI